jgi:hypothetical protein
VRKNLATNGTRSASITISDLGTRLSQILVASATKPGEDWATLRIPRVTRDAPLQNKDKRVKLAAGSPQ